MFPVLAGKFLTTGLPGKPLEVFLNWRDLQPSIRETQVTEVCIESLKRKRTLHKNRPQYLHCLLEFWLITSHVQSETPREWEKKHYHKGYDCLHSNQASNLHKETSLNTKTIFPEINIT